MNLGIQSMASVVREGDYFVITNGKNGTEVSYAPSGPPGGSILGAFGVCRGALIYLRADEALARRATAGSEEVLESELCRDAEVLASSRRTTRSQEPRAPRGSLDNAGQARVTQQDQVRAALRAAARGSVLGETFSGTWADLARFLGLGEEAVLPQYFRRYALRVLSAFPLGFEVTEGGRGPGNGARVTIHWDHVFPEEAPPNIKE